jgi:hypothetical protein
MAESCRAASVSDAAERVDRMMDRLPRKRTERELEQ